MSEPWNEGGFKELFKEQSRCGFEWLKYEETKKTCQGSGDNNEFNKIMHHLRAGVQFS